MHMGQSLSLRRIEKISFKNIRKKNYPDYLCYLAKKFLDSEFLEKILMYNAH